MGSESAHNTRPGCGMTPGQTGRCSRAAPAGYPRGGRRGFRGEFPGLHRLPAGESAAPTRSPHRAACGRIFTTEEDILRPRIHQDSEFITCTCGGALKGDNFWRASTEMSSAQSTRTMATGYTSLIPTWRQLTLLLLTLLVTLTSHVTSAQTWEAEPVDTDVMENGRATLRCQIRNLGDSKIAWLRANKNFFVDGDRWVAPPRFNVSKVARPEVGGYDLILNGATRADDADYTCQLQSQTLIATAHLTVLVKPRILTITKSRSDLEENDEVTFTCVTSEGNPPPVIRWYRRTDQSQTWEELTGAVTTPPATKFNESSSVLTRRMTRADHKAHLKCTASNAAVTAAPPEHIITLDVKYAPIVTISPSDATGNHLVVVEGRNATLTCRVDSNPYTSSRKWEKDGVQIPDVNYRAVAKEDSGNYTCVATNVIRSTRTWLTLDVQYVPEVVVAARGLNNNRLFTAEGARVNLSCSVRANPPVSALQWKNVHNAVLSWDRNYVINDVRRTHAGSYSCFVESVLRPTLQPELPVQGTQTVELIVQYPPGKANITGPHYVLVGDDAVLRCHLADKGVPEATLEWTRLGDPQNRVISREPELRFTPAQLTNNADYICKPTNAINDGEPDTFRLVVNESPTWLPGGELPGRMTVNVTTPGALMVQCQARGRPLPRVRWYLDDTSVNDLDGLFTVETEHVAIDTYSFLVTSTLYWRGRGRDRLDRLRRSDTGRYQCQFTNDHGEVHSDMMLTVQYMPVLNVTSDKVATDMNQSAVLSCSSHAVPAPRFTWYNRTSLLVPSARVAMSTENVPGEFPYKATLNISDVTSDDLGEYKCVGVNDLGFAEKYIFLTVKTTPDAPTNLQVASRTWESVELSWSEGFDGGYRPTYFVFYTSARHNNTRVKVVPTNNRFNVTGLYPSLTYTFKVFGENQLGGGEYSANISTVTDAHPIEPPTEVFYHLVKRTLTFRSPSTNYCVRIEIFDGATWRDYAECAPPSGSVKIREGVPVSDVRIALCLQRRKEICSDKTKAFPVKPPPDDLSVETIIIVACVCGTVVLVLLFILIFLCIRRHQARKKDYENDMNAQRAAQAAGGNKKMAGIDNPSLDQTDVVDLDDRTRGRVFANDTSRQNNANYVMFDRQKAQNAQNGSNHANGYPPMNGGPNWNRPNGNLPNDPPPDYREIAKDGTTESEYIAMHKARKARPKSDVPDGHDSGYVPDHMKEGPDSGLSTPDPTKPKKFHQLHPSELRSLPRPGFQHFPFNEPYIQGQYMTHPSNHVYSISHPHPDGKGVPLNPHQVLTPSDNLTAAPSHLSSTYSDTSLSLSSPYPDNFVIPSSKLQYPTMTSSVPAHPVLRVAGDSPYGFHGVVQPPKPAKKKKPNKASPPVDAPVHLTGSHLRRVATVSSKDLKPDLPRTDFIRGTLHDSMRLPPTRRPEEEETDRKLQKQGSFHYGFPESKRPIHATSYGMFQKFMQAVPPAPCDAGQDSAPRQYSDGGETYSGVGYSYSPHPPPTAPRPDRMSMQVSQPGLEVQLEVIHHRTSSVDLQQQLSSKENHQKAQVSSQMEEIIAKRSNLKPVGVAKKPPRNDLPTDPRDAMAQLLKEQKTVETEVSDGEDEEQVHNVKPSAVKKMLHKRKEKRNVPKVSRRPQTLAEAMNKLSNSQNVSIGRGKGAGLVKQITPPTQNELETIRRNLSSIEKQSSKETVSSISKQSLSRQQEVDLGGSRQQIVDGGNDSMSVCSSEGGKARQMKGLPRLCSVCHQSTVIHTPDIVEAVTDFTTPVTGSTVFKTKKFLCEQCQSRNVAYDQSPSVNSHGQHMTNTLPTEQYSQVDWASNMMTLPMPDPPYESDTDSTLPEYPTTNGKTTQRSKDKRIQGRKGKVTRGRPMYVIPQVSTCESLYGVSSLSSYSDEYSDNPYGTWDQDQPAQLNDPPSVVYNPGISDNPNKTGSPQRDITKHFVPPPPNTPAPVTPNDVSKKLPPQRANNKDSGEKGNQSKKMAGGKSRGVITVPSPPSTRPPTPPSVSLIPSWRIPPGQGVPPGRSIQHDAPVFPSNEGGRASHILHDVPVFPDVRVTAPTPGTSLNSREQAYTPESLLLPSGVSGRYYHVNSPSSSSASDLPRSDHVSTSVTSQDDVTSSSATSGGAHASLTPVTLIL